MYKRFKVRFFQDSTYEVFELRHTAWDDEWEKVYQGSLVDCEAYIRLHENGYM